MGGIAVGKSTLIEGLSNYFKGYPEEPESNPYIENLSHLEESTYLSQLYFLSKRFQSQLSAQYDEISVVERTIFEDAEIFADYYRENGVISDKQWEHYVGVYKAYCKIIKRPNLVIFIDATSDDTIKLIRERGRDSEKNIDLEFVKSVLLAYRSWMDSWAGCPVIKLHTAELIRSDATVDIYYEIIRHMADR